MSFTAASNLPKVYDTYDFISPSRFTGKLKGRVVVITGASAGLGREACLAFAAAGASVACVARRQEALDSLVSEIKDNYSVNAIAIAVDVSDPAASKEIIEQTERELGPVYILLNCAGITRLSTLADEEDFAAWWRVQEINLRGPVALTHAVLPSMIKRKSGIVISVSSTAGTMDAPFLTAYGASKAAIIKFHQSLALEMEKHGVLSYSVHPGTVATELSAVEGAINPSVMQEPEAQGMIEEFKKLKYQSPTLLADVCVAICANQRFAKLSGRMIDAEQPLDQVLDEVEKEGDGRIGKENLYRIKLDEL